ISTMNPMYRVVSATRQYESNGTVAGSGGWRSAVVTYKGAPTNVTTVTIAKISLGGVGQFSFSGTNGIVSQSITTRTPGIGVQGNQQTLTTAGASTDITEGAPPAGFKLTDISCTGLGTGGSSTADLNTRTVTLDATATAVGSSITCTFTNTKEPTVTVTK